MDVIKCDVGYIYALYYNGKPFYIGQTKKTISYRFSQHKNSFTKRNKLVYRFLLSITDKYSFYDNVKIRPLKAVSVYNLDYEEMRYVKHCIDNGITIYNDCVKTNSYRVYKNLAKKG